MAGIGLGATLGGSGPGLMAALSKDFLSFFACEREQKKIQDLGYAPLPSDVASKVLGSAQALS